MKEQLSHILDQSVCLTRRQVAAYLEGRMEPEELHAAQMHIASCPLCSLAMDGFEDAPKESLAALSTLNTDFLKEQFDKSLPQIHLNSVAPAAVIRETRRRRRAGEHRVLPFRRLAAAAALMLTAGGLWWLLQNAGKDTSTGGRELAVLSTGETTAPASAAQPPIAQPEPATPAAAPVTTTITAAPSLQSPSRPAAAAPQPAVQDAVAAAGTADQPTAELAPQTSLAPANDNKVDLSSQVTTYNYSRSATPPDSRGYGNSFQSTNQYKFSATDEPTVAGQNRGTVFTDRTEGAPTAPAPRPTLKASADKETIAARRRNASPTVAPGTDRSDRVVVQPPVSAPSMEAARKALDAGKREEAKRILQALVQQGGSEKREAKKLLRRLRREDN